MSFEELSDLELLQLRVGSAEVLLALVCEHLTDEQKTAIQSRINSQKDAWKDKGIVFDIFDGADTVLNKTV